MFRGRRACPSTRAAIPSAGACHAPWPSSAFEVDGPTTVTGRRLAIPDDALPRGVRDEEIDPFGVEPTQLAAALCAVVVGIDLRGRSSSDVPAVERAIADLGNAGSST